MFDSSSGLVEPHGELVMIVEPHTADIATFLFSLFFGRALLAQAIRVLVHRRLFAAIIAQLPLDSEFFIAGNAMLSQQQVCWELVAAIDGAIYMGPTTSIIISNSGTRHKGSSDKRVIPAVIVPSQANLLSERLAELKLASQLDDYFKFIVVSVSLRNIMAFGKSIFLRCFAICQRLLLAILDVLFSSFLVFFCSGLEEGVNIIPFLPSQAEDEQKLDESSPITYDTPLSVP